MCSVVVKLICNPQGPDDFNGYGCLFVRLYWTGFGFQANMVEECAGECVAAHLRWFDESYGSEVVFWIDEWSIEFGHHLFEVLSVPHRRYRAIFLAPSMEKSMLS